MRVPLGEPEEAKLPLAVEPIAGGQAVLVVSQAAGERVGWARWIDAQGRMGPALRLVDEHVVGAFAVPDGKTALLTSDGERLCVARYGGADETPEARGCARVDAKLVALVGDRLALVDTAALIKEDKGAAKKPITTRTPEKQRPAEERAKKAPAGTKRDIGKKKPRKGRTGARAEPPKKPAPKVPVEVRLRWASSAGEFEEQARPTGLKFEPPQDGMSLVDAAGTARGVTLVWYETGKPPKGAKLPPGPPSLGWAMINAGVIGPDGAFDPKSRAKVAEGELEWGGVRGHFAPRLFASEAAGVLLAQTVRRGPCEAFRVWPAITALPASRVACALDPLSLARGGPAPADLPGLELIYAADPRRAAGQPRPEPGLVAWAGDRAYFVPGEGRPLRSAGHDGVVRDEPAPFPGKRARMAWATAWPDGTGAAFAGGKVVRLDASGSVQDGLAGKDIAPSARALATSPAAQHRAARIGETIWMARGDVARVHPEPLSPAAWKGRGHPDATALVGGAERGMLLELSGDRLFVSGIDGAGAIATPASPDGRPRSAASPVRAGFLAVERAGGGAIVAGVSAADATRVAAFVIDGAGRLGPVTTTRLTVRPGELGVRLAPLPGGGAVLSDLGRNTAVWLDDDGHERALGAWPAGEASAHCLDGVPGRKFVPAEEPGRFVEVLAMAEAGACVVGEPVWAEDGSLRWFGSTARDRDVLAEAFIAPGLGRGASKALAKDAPAGSIDTSPGGARVCPAEMVLVGGKLCVDRFEGTIVDVASGEQISPDYPVTPNLMEVALGEWATGRQRTGGLHARAFPMPLLPGWQRGQNLGVVAVPRMGARPNGYLTGLVAESACAAAGKRLCTLAEFTTACRGEEDTLFPYGDTYVDGVCNVYRDAHPAAILHDNASVGHLDPRLNRVRAGKAPLFRAAGATPACQSRWGSDAIYDMVGNLDEWVDEGGGAFAGGFYARSTRSGCEALITAHPKHYLDYSTGVRCCKDAGR
jgi:chorismate mutase